MAEVEAVDIWRGAMNILMVVLVVVGAIGVDAEVFLKEGKDKEMTW